jgi:hypothetical protein
MQDCMSLETHNHLELLPDPLIMDQTITEISFISGLKNHSYYEQFSQR